MKLKNAFILSIAFIFLATQGCQTRSGLQAGDVKAADVLSIAKKYYDFCVSKLDGALSAGLKALAGGSVSFAETNNEAGASGKLVETSSLQTALHGNGDMAVAAAAAAVGKAPKNPEAAYVLATVLQEAQFLPDDDRLADAIRCAAYAISIDDARWEFYYKLAQLLCETEDYDAAEEAVDKALAIEPANLLCLELKQFLLLRKGMTGPAMALDEVIADADTILGKTLRDTAEEAQKITFDLQGEAPQLKEALLKVLELEPITTADMIEEIFPEEAAEIRRRVSAVNAGDKINLPAFPADLFSSTKKALVDGREAIDGWAKWLDGKQMEISNRTRTTIQAGMGEISQFLEEQGMPDFTRMTEQEIMDFAEGMQKEFMENPGSAALQPDPGAADRRLSKPDLMVRYNAEIVNTATVLWNAYVLKRYGDFQKKEFIPEHTLVSERKGKLHQAFIDWCKANPNAPDQEVRKRSIEMKLKQNMLTNSFYQKMVNRYLELYTEAKNLGEKTWEEMVPFMRASELPEVASITAECQIYQTSATLLASLAKITLSYNADIDPQDLQEAEKALKKAEEYKKGLEASRRDLLEGFKLSVSLGPVSFSLSQHSMEISGAAVVAGHVSYNWKKGRLDIGAGVGAKLGIGPVIGAGAAATTHFVFDLKKMEVVDIYYAVKASGGIKGPVGTSTEAKYRFSILHGTSQVSGTGQAGLVKYSETLWGDE